MLSRNWLVGFLVGLVSLAIAGCGSEGSYRLHINFPNEYAKQSISGLTLWAVGAGDADCEQVMLGEVEPDNLNIRAKTSIPYPAGEEPVFDQVPSGKLLFIVDGLNQAGIVLLRGCEPVRVEGGATVDVTVTLEWVCEPDPQGEVADNQKDDDCDGKVDEEECLTDVECDDNNTCTADTCTDQECMRVPVENGWACDDGSYCTMDDACMNGVCLGVLNDCDDDDTCTQDSCNQDLERCDHVMRLIPDAEGPPGNSTCSNGSDDDCDGLTDGEDPSCKTCTQDDECDDGLPCTQDACAGGDCENIPIADGTACDDADSCTTEDACLSGVCVGTGYSCEDGNVCTNDICNGDGTCSHDNNTFPCDDNDPCTRDDVCSQGACSGTAYSCDDDNVCTDDSCSGDGTCNHINNSAPCDDADACTMSDTCAGGSCSGVPLDADGDRYVDENCGGDDCDDNDAGVSPGVFETDPACGDGIDNDCDGLTDTADPGCQNCTQDGDCDDDNVCNGLESCQGGVCSAGTALFCDDDNNCTDDSCDPIDGCRHVDNAVSCDDGDPCTSGDACSGGECAGTPYSCIDGNQCTDDTCNGDGTCSNVNNADPCDDGDPCTRDDTCSDGSCMGMRYFCNDDNPCTDDSCNGDGTCSNPNNTNPCDDGDDCTMDDACSGGVCAGAPMDADHDGYVAESCGGDDCDDGSAAANPGETEGPPGDASCRDGVDNDCDDLTDIYDADDCREIVTVEPVYVSNADWNSYVKHLYTTRDEYHQDDVACDGTETGGYSACIHGGEKRMVTVSGLASCTDLVLEEDLGVFEWVCQDNGGLGPVTFYTARVKKGSGLRDLIDINGFKVNAVTIKDASSQVSLAYSTPAIWGWTNPVEPLPDNSSSEVVWLDEEWKIYFLEQSRYTNGYNINADRVTVVNLEGAILTYAGSSDDNCNAASGEYVPGYASGKCLVAAGEQKFLWIEGDFNSNSPSGSNANRTLLLTKMKFSRLNNVSSIEASYRGMVLNDCVNNYFYNVDIYDSGNTCIGMSDCNYNIFEGLRSVICGDWGMTLGGDVGCGHNTFIDVHVEKSAQRGFVIYDGQYNTIVNLTAFDNGDYAGVNVYDQHNRLYNVHAHHNSGSGIVITESFNTVVNAFLTNNTSSGLRLFSNWVDVSDNTLVNLLIANNGGKGISSDDSAHQNTFSHVTAVNNGLSGLYIHSGDNCVLNQIVAVNNAEFGIALAWGAPTDNIVSQAACVHNGDHNVRSTDCRDNRWTGAFLVEDIADNCWVESGSSPGLIDNTCTDTGEEGSNVYTGQLSDATLHLVDLSASFAGKVSQDDSVNPSDSSGIQVESLIADWSHFESIHRSWGVDGSVFPGSDNRGDCGSGTCRIWDWRLLSSDTALLDFNGAFQVDAPCPDSVHGNVALIDGHTTPNIFLANATEILFDPLGDDDGLCETGEACVFSPNFGFYQGEGDHTANTCQFQDGLVSGVHMYAYPANGL